MADFQVSKIKDITYIVVTLMGLILSVAGAYFSITSKLNYLGDRIAALEQQCRSQSEKMNFYFEKFYGLQYDFGVFKAKVDGYLERRQ